ncbi:MAG: polyprenol monophosphomannose synthase [Chloroflexota bacterium]|nr:polyprenol monophosphomannose synthase [Chloroflexota bacterium]
MPTVAVIIPTYNESENLERLVRLILDLPLEPEVIVVDDNSPDGTGQIADRLAAEKGRIHVIHRPGKLGLGTAYIAGFRRALSLGVECIITMDADFSHHPRYIPDLVAHSDGAQVVVGSRYVQGGGTRYCSLKRRLLSRGANGFARLMLGLEARDCTAGFRCYRRRALEAIDLDAILSDGYSFLIEMLYQCQSRGYHTAEVPIVFEDRRHGVSKISRQEIFKAIYTVLRLALDRL